MEKQNNWMFDIFNNAAVNQTPKIIKLIQSCGRGRAEQDEDIENFNLQKEAVP